MAASSATAIRPLDKSHHPPTLDRCDGPGWHALNSAGCRKTAQGLAAVGRASPNSLKASFSHQPLHATAPNLLSDPYQRGVHARTAVSFAAGLVNLSDLLRKTIVLYRSCAARTLPPGEQPAELTLCRRHITLTGNVASQCAMKAKIRFSSGGELDGFF